ncbi:MAG: prolyl-tRNA synthetase associated domain-containing protein [Mogibacterium sp.]|nr:prolyl-tRNA synthetase associated domain-containing protein [Mogibacterium sp.]
MVLTKEDIIRILKERKIEYELVEHKAVYTIDEMLECDLPHTEQIAKNLFIRDDKKRKYYLITCLEDKKINLKEFRNEHGTRPLSFASEDDLMSKMGLIRGAVTPLGILANEEKDIIVYFDKDYEHKLMGIHPCDNKATIYINTRDVAKLIKEHGNELHFIKI